MSLPLLTSCAILNQINLILYRAGLRLVEKQCKRESMMLLLTDRVACLSEGSPDFQSPLLEQKF